MESNREWYSINLSKNNAEDLKEFLYEHDIYYEPSSAGNLIHFECLMNQEEYDLVIEYFKGRWE